jgi:hypothetical protein
LLSTKESESGFLPGENMIKKTALWEQGGCEEVSREEESSYCLLGGTSESLDSCEPTACKEATISGLFELTSGKVEVSCCRVLGGLIQRKDPFLCRRSHALIQPGLDPLKTAA